MRAGHTAAEGRGGSVALAACKTFKRTILCRLARVTAHPSCSAPTRPLPAAAATGLALLQQRTKLGAIAGAEENADICAMLSRFAAAFTRTKNAGVLVQIGAAQASYKAAVSYFQRDNDLPDVRRGAALWFPVGFERAAGCGRLAQRRGFSAAIPDPLELAQKPPAGHGHGDLLPANQGKLRPLVGPGTRFSLKRCSTNLDIINASKLVQWAHQLFPSSSSLQQLQTRRTRGKDLSRHRTEQNSYIMP
jgi:hypothetical protein